MYKIEAIIKNAKTTPVIWLRYSKKPMTIKECLKIITPSLKGKALQPKVEIMDFRCIQVSDME